MNECNCALGPFWRDYCPVHAANPGSFPPDQYTFTPPHNDTYPFAPFPSQGTIQTQFFISHNPSLDFHNVLSPQPGYHDVHPSLTSNTIPQPLPFEVAPTATFPVMDPLASRSALPTDGWAISHHDPSRIATSSTTIPAPPPNVPYSDHITTVNAVEAYGVPVGAASSINQTIAVDSVPNPSNPPVMIDQKSWYSEYGVDRGANGLFHCPFPGCAKENKRRDQLWEHWKAKHNNDPYRCGRCNKTWIYNGENAHACSAEMTTCQFCQKYLTKHHITDHQKTRACMDKRRNNNGIPYEGD